MSFKFSAAFQISFKKTPNRKYYNGFNLGFILRTNCDYVLGLKMKLDDDGNVLNCCTNCLYFKPILRRCTVYTGMIIIRECTYCRNFFPKTE